jgi:hypothetical protein
MWHAQVLLTESHVSAPQQSPCVAHDCPEIAQPQARLTHKPEQHCPAELHTVPSTAHALPASPALAS